MNFLNIKRFQKAADKLGDLHTIISAFLKPFFVFEIGFQNSFITTAATFPRSVLPITTFINPWKPASKVMKIIRKISYFRMGFF
jgi:hypothetical protein